jgi:hypothetical protein
MTFDRELEDLEADAYEKLKDLPRGTLERQDNWRSTSDTKAQNDRVVALNAVIDFKEHRRSNALSWAKEFSLKFASEIKGQICSDEDKQIGNLADITPKTAASAIAAWIVGSFGVINPIAFAMATLVVLVLARALRTTFCGMSADEIKEAIRLNY